MRPGIFLLVLSVAATAAARPAWAQSWPEGPIVVELGGAGRLVLGGEVSAAAGRKDATGFFNYTGYEHNTLRLVRLALAARWQPSERVAVLGDVRSENLEAPRAYALYVRLSPFDGVPLDVQAGRIPPVFGRFARHAYAADNPLIGYPLAYQYLTSLRADAVPGSPADLLRMRGRGWLLSYPVGSSAAAPGLPVISAFRYDTGVQARYAPGMFELAAAVTTGTLSNPRLGDDNGGRQIAVRAGAQPVAGLIAGVSASRGAWLSDAVVPAGADTAYRQDALGIDAEYSRGRWLVRGELIQSRWRLPAIASAVTARTGFAEGRIRVHPRAFVAARVDRLDFSRLASAGAMQTWDAPVTRIEAGAGWYFRRNLVAKAAWQHNWRDGGRQREASFASAQVLFWF
ncbi:MAG TPA: hypothetical protein VFZ36_01570 [Vicinamibacterales bacterium]